MHGTTFPSFPDHTGEVPPPQNEFMRDVERAEAPAGGFEKKPWQGNQGGEKKPWQGGGEKKPWNGEKKPWQGGGGGGGGKPFQRPVETDMSLYKPYAATGNREATPEICQKFAEIAKMLERYGYTARVGGFEGIEEAVEKATTKHEVHLPFREFNQKQSKFTYTSDRAMAVAKMFHPTFDTMKKGVQLFLAKNARLVLGDKMNAPALFLLCWTEDGVESVKDRTSRSGFTGHPIAIASALGIPVFNLGKPNAEQRLNMYLDSVNQAQPL